MANKKRGEIAADFDGKKIKLILSTDAICQLEDAADLPIVDFLEKLDPENKPRMGAIRLMIWAMMLDARPEATLKDASRLIDGMAGRHQQIMSDAITAAFPEPDGDVAPGKPVSP